MRQGSGHSDHQTVGVLLALPLGSCAALGKLLNLSESHFPHMENRDDHGLSLIDLLGDSASRLQIWTHMSPVSKAVPGHLA